MGLSRRRSCLFRGRSEDRVGAHAFVLPAKSGTEVKIPTLSQRTREGWGTLHSLPRGFAHAGQPRRLSLRELSGYAREHCGQEGLEGSFHAFTRFHDLGVRERLV